MGLAKCQCYFIRACSKLVIGDGLMEEVKNPQNLVSVACEWLLRHKKHYRERRAGRIKLIKNIKTKHYCVF